MKTKLLDFLNNNKYILILLILTLIGAVFRFHNLNWDGDYFFHPDERNIADAVHRIDFSGCADYFTKNLQQIDPRKCDFNPNFFAYGTLPIYITRLFADENFDRTLIILRSESALLSTLLIPLYFWITHLILSKKSAWWAILVAFFIAFNPGLIQFAHFGTCETYLTFEYSIFFLFLIKYIQTQKTKFFLWAACFLGIAIGTKIVSLSLVPALYLPHLLMLYKKHWAKDIKLKEKLMSFLLDGTVKSILIAFLFFLLCSPFVLLDWQAFKGSMNYEGPVADGSLPVFYTQQFNQTIPALYQFTKVFPYILGVLATLLFSAGFIAYGAKLVLSLKKLRTNYQKPGLIILLALMLILFGYGGSHFTLFVKWTRYMIPLLPFMILLNVMFLALLHKQVAALGKIKWILYIFCSFLILSAVFDGYAMFYKYTQADGRIQAMEWVEANMPESAVLLHESADIGVIPIQTIHGQNLRDFNVYDFDNEDPTPYEEFQTDLKQADYIVVLANRLYPTRFRLPAKYPRGYNFYEGLNNGSLGFQQVAAFNRENGLIRNKIDIKILSSEPAADETFTVFDDPLVIIYKRI